MVYLNMDAGSRTEYLRNLCVYINYRDRAPYKTNSVPDNQILNERIVGSYECASACNCTTNDLLPQLPCVLKTIVIEALESLLTYTATTNKGPTKSSRLHYLFFMTMATGYNWVQPSGPINGTKDNWNWDTRYPLTSTQDVFIWMTHLIATVMPLMVPGYNPSALLAMERDVFSWDVAAQTTYVAALQAKGQWALWYSAWTTWYVWRSNDGNVLGAVPPTTAQLPNGATVLDVSVSQDFTDATAYPNPKKWTPLKVIGVTQTYATYGWNGVQSTCLSPTDEQAVKSKATPPTDAQRETEIGNLVTLTSALVDSQKVQAEFWAGGPYTVSPPGMFVWFWKTLINVQTVSDDAVIYSGLDLAIQLFEVGRVIWGLKQYYMEARPIQDIRRLYAGQTLTKYDGTPIAGNLWVPYQTPTFVTPPFADYPSGHSAFSQCFANVMSDWFGATIPATEPIVQTDINLLSHVFATRQTNPFGTWTFPAHTSEIQPGLVPATDQVLAWSTWQGMADSAGLSRQYGGIHCQSAHVGSQAVANELYTYVRANWGFNPF